MKNQNHFWIGYGEFEDLLKASLAESDQTLYLDTCVETLPTNVGALRIQKFSVLAARLDHDHGVCHYWKILTGKADVWAGDDRDEKATAANKRMKHACDFLEAEAARRGFLVSKAIVAQPKDLILLEGDTSLLRYDKSADLYLPATELAEVA